MEARPYFDFEWQRDDRGTAGYRLAPRVPERKPAIRREPVMHWLGFPVSMPTRLEMAPSPEQPARIFHLGGNLKPYRPLHRFPKLHKQFAERVQSDQSLLAFIGKFGPLTLGGLDPGTGENVPVLLEHASSMRGFLSLSLEELVERIGTDRLKLLPLETTMIVDPATRSLQLTLTPPDLLCALWLQLGQFLDGTDRRQCLYCKEPFEVGPGTGRRQDAKFCSDQHRTRYHNRQRGREQQSHA
jgi:hypothetical protein